VLLDCTDHLISTLPYWLTYLQIAEEATTMELARPDFLGTAFT